MLTIISGTNRKGSNTLKIAKVYHQILNNRGIKANLVSLEDLDINDDIEFKNLETGTLIPTTHFIIICPEYNGSFPGIFKLMIDKSQIQPSWHHKKLLLTGVASGRAGNLRGLDHLTNVFNHIKVTVFPNKLPISGVNNVVDSAGEVTDANTMKAINQQLDEFILWAALNPEPQTEII